MHMYQVPCTDRSDRRCHKFIEQAIAIPDLSEEQLQELAENGRTTISKEQLEDSAEYIRQQIEPEDVGEDNDVFLEVDSICSACGSDQAHSDDGENITAI